MGLTLWVKGLVVAHPLYIRFQSGPQGFLRHSYLCFRVFSLVETLA
jgi:hypothetical protein